MEHEKTLVMGNVAMSEIYTSATKDYVTVGPDSTYNAFGTSVSWDIGNLIWSDDQTNIDVRSRLMV